MVKSFVKTSDKRMKFGLQESYRTSIRQPDIHIEKEMIIYSIDYYQQDQELYSMWKTFGMYLPVK